MATTNTLTIFVTPVIGEEICIEKACTLKQAVTLAKKEARKMINNGGMWVTINIQARASYGVETLAHIEAEKEGRRVVFSDETPAETYAVCWGDEYKEEDGENNVIAETTDESEAREIALNESRENGCAMSVVRMSDKTAVLVISDSIGLAPEAAAAYDALCSSFVDTYQPEPTNPDNTPTTMNANETRKKSINSIMNQASRLMSVCNGARNFNRADAIREIAFRYYDNIRACVGRFNYNDDSEYDKEYSRAQYMNANEAIANTPANLAKLHTLAVNGTPMYYIWLDAVDDAATTSVYLTEDAARANIARLEADDKEAGIYEPDAYRIINAAPYFA